MQKPTKWPSVEDIADKHKECTEILGELFMSSSPDICVCPYCGETESDIFEWVYDGEDHERECGECDQVYYVGVCHSYSLTIRRRDDGT